MANYIIDRIKCERSSCVHRKECIVLHPVNSITKERNGTYYPTVHATFSGAFFVYCDNFENRDKDD